MSVSSPTTSATASAAQSAFRALNRIVLPLAKSGIGAPLPIGAGVVVLETTGRVSKQQRQVPLVATRVGNRVTVSTVRSNSQWVRNLEADARGALWLDGKRRDVTATSIARGPLTRVSLETTEPT